MADAAPDAEAAAGATARARATARADADREPPVVEPKPSVAEPGSPTSPRPRRRGRRRRLRRGVAAMVGRVRHASVRLWPGFNETSVPRDFLVPKPAPVVVVRPTKPSATEPGASERRLPPGIRHVGTVVSAVYTALADPLVNADETAREQRAAHVRRAGMVTAGAVLTAVLVYSIFPVRTYLDQRAATQRARERIEVISRENERLTQYLEDLRDAETVEEIARRDYGMVFPEEEPYAVLPPPAETTTTASTTTVPTPP